jgi:hypothetical protein
VRDERVSCGGGGCFSVPRSILSAPQNALPNLSASSQVNISLFHYIFVSAMRNYSPFTELHHGKRVNIKEQTG